MHHDQAALRLDRQQRIDVRQRAAYLEPAVVTGRQREPGLAYGVQHAYGFRCVVGDRQPDVEQGTGIVLADRGDPRTPASRSSKAVGSGD